MVGAGNRGAQVKRGSGALVLLAWLLALAGATWILFARFPSLDPSIIELQLAGSPDAAEVIVAKWLQKGLLADARKAIVFDYAFIPLYVIVLATLAWWGSKESQSPLVRRAGRGLVTGIAFAGALDLIENTALLNVVPSFSPTAVGIPVRVDTPWPEIAAAAAWPKFFLVGPATAFAVWFSLNRLRLALQAKAHPAMGDREGLGLVPQSLPGPARLEKGAVPSWRADEWKPAKGRIGICCSGGGIRSAAYNLGALQALQQADVLRKAEYICAVSGGSYIASAYAMVLAESDPKLLSERPVFSPGSPEEAYLRNRSSYLAPDLLGKGRLTIRLLMGLTLNLLYLWMVLFVVSRPLGWLIASEVLHPELRLPKQTEASIEPHLWLTVAWPAIFAYLAGVVAVAGRFQKDRWYRWWVRVATALAALAGVLFLVLIALPWLTRAVPTALQDLYGILTPGDDPTRAGTRNATWVIQLVGASALGGAILRVLTRERARIALAVAAIVAPALGFLSIILLTRDAGIRGVGGDMTVLDSYAGTQLAWVGGTALVLLMFTMISDQTTWSMHPFYKRRLSSAFALRRVSREGAEPLPYDEFQKLSLYKSVDGPELVVCAAANLSEEGATPPGRGSVSFVFTSKEVGGSDTGWIPTKEMEEALGNRRLEDITLPAAVAVSGAALSPAMGKRTKRSVGPLLALANARLGVWLPNPRWVRRLRLEGVPCWRDRPRIGYLLKEIVGRHRKNDRYLYVTDGGHWENLGLVELLRRGCTEIYCFDASGDAVDTFFTIGEAVALARTELRVEIDIDPEVLEPDEKMKKRSTIDHVVARFRYLQQGIEGRLVFAKAAVTQDAPWDVKAYAERDPVFPTHSVVDQLYTDQKFEAYRALGHHTAQRAMKTMARVTEDGVGDSLRQAWNRLFG
jgi:Patatin-like phospholipase